MNVDWITMRLRVMADVADGGRSVYLLVRLEAEATPPAERSPVNLALAIDRSSSMRGPRMAQAIRAACEVVAKLDDRDRLTVIAFDGSARIVFGPDRVGEEERARLRRALAELDTGAGTNLAAAIRKGADALKAGYVRGAVARLILLTDGQPSVGVTDAEKLAALAEAEYKSGVPITAMGVGEGFEDELLAEIARRGRGGFYYLANPADIPAAFGHELAGVFAIAATQAELKLVPHDEVRAVDLLHRVPSRPGEDGLTVEIGEIASGAPRQLLFRLSRRATAESTNCGTLRLTWRRPDGRPGDGHIVGIELPRLALGEERQQVLLERLRVAVATAVDLAWARRASGDAGLAQAGLAEIKRQVLEARDRGAAPRDELGLLIDDLSSAEDAVTSSEAEHERVRRSLRERSQVTLLGHAIAGRAPSFAEED
jgi:Ca-activated chloride channel family protein